MRIGLFCNMNNNFFSLVRHLRDQGRSAQLFCFETDHAHFNPDNDALDDAHLAYVQTLPWGRGSHLLKTSAREIRTVFDEFDAIVGCGMALAYAHKAGRRTDAFVPFGGDLYGEARVPPLRLGTLRKSLKARRLARLQRDGIRDARMLMTELEVYGGFAREVGFTGALRDTHMPMVYDYTEQLRRASVVAGSAFAKRYNTLRASSDFLVFHHARHVWKTRAEPTAVKGNDVLIRGFKRFVDAGECRAPLLVMFENGVDVALSKALVHELDLGAHVAWFPVTPRREIFYGLLGADVAAGQFGLPCALNGVIQEALVCAKPLLHHRADAARRPSALDPLYPICEAGNEPEVAAALSRLWRDPDLRYRLGQQSRAWYQEVLTPRFFAAFDEVIPRD